MSNYRFPLRGKIGIVRGRDGEVPSRLISVKREPGRAKRRLYALNDTEPLTEEEVRNLPVAHRYSA
jgi:hypothetical protein